MATHDLSGTCQHCDLIFRKFPMFAGELMIWFKATQLEHPEFHISCAGRGRESQESLYAQGLSRARYGQSSHNYNMGIDTFRLLNEKYDLNQDWYDLVIQPRIGPTLTWYGAAAAKFKELPHIEIASWRELVALGHAVLVEK